MLEILLTLSFSHSYSLHLNLGHNSMPTLQYLEWVVVLAGTKAYLLCDTECPYGDTYPSFSVTFIHCLFFFFNHLVYYKNRLGGRINVVQYSYCFNNVWNQNLWDTLVCPLHKTGLFPTVSSFPLPNTFSSLKYFDTCSNLKYYSTWLKSQVQSLVLDSLDPKRRIWRVRI